MKPSAIANRLRSYRLSECSQEPSTKTGDRTMKALIGDSDFASRSDLAAALTALGYEAVTCCTAKEIRCAFANDLYALIFLRVDETVDAPLSICQWLRTQASGEAVCIVALTA